MARNGTGTYLLPAGNPVSAGTVIESTWANDTLTDIANALTGSLPTDGQKPMSAPLKLTDGTVTSPSLTFNSQSSTGLFWPATGLLAITVGGAEAARFKSNGNVMIGTTTDNGQKLQVNGAIAGGAGTVSAPGHTFVGDTNTGLWNPSADVVGVAIGGVDRFRLSGNSLTVNGSTSGAALFSTSSSVSGGASILSVQTGTQAFIDLDAQPNLSTDEGIVRVFRSSPATSANTSLIVYSPNTATATTRIYADGRAQFSNGSVGSPALSFLSDTDTGLYRIGSDNLGFSTGGTLRSMIDSSGVVSVGSSGNTFDVVQGATAYTPAFQVAASGIVGLGVGRFTNDTSGGYMTLAKSRATTVGNKTATASSDVLGVLNFVGTDGTSWQEGAAILASVDGTVATGYHPGHLQFRTRNDGAGIATFGAITGGSGYTNGVYTDVPLTGGTGRAATANITVTGGAVTAVTLVLTGYEYRAGDVLSAATANIGAGSGFSIPVATVAANTSASEKVRIDSRGNVGIGSSALSNISLRLARNITGSTTAYGMYTQASVQADVTTAGYVFYSAATAANSYETLGTFSHFVASPVAWSGRTVTNHVGYQASSAIGGQGTNNFGFFGQLAAGTGNWNFYASGTAPNYFAGQTLIGTSNTAIATRTAATSFIPILQVAGSVGADSSALLSRWTASSNASYLSFSKSRSNTTGTHSVVSSGDNLGVISFAGSDGTQFTEAARIIASVDGTAGTDDMPGRLEFYTTADGGLTPAERMRIDSSGNVLINQTTTYAIDGFTANQFQMASTGGSAGLSTSVWSASNTGTDVQAMKSRGATIGTRGLVAANDNLLSIVAAGDDGTNFIRAAQIVIAVDGTPGTNDMPGRMTFATTDDGSATPSERMRLDSAGQILMGTTTAPSQTTTLTVFNNLARCISLTNSDTNAANKVGRISSKHYTNAEEDMSVIGGSTTSSGNTVQVGGGGSTLNAATDITFHTAANNTTLTGTNRGGFDSVGQFTLLANIASTSTTTGTAVVTGGLGVSGDVNALTLTRTGALSSASWTTTGAAFASIGNTLTDTTGTGTIATRVGNSFGAPTLASSSAVTVTNASTVYISTAPAAGTNTTITNTHALHIAGGRTFLAAGGSASGPALAIRDVDLGLYSSAAGVLNFTVASSSVGTITSTGLNAFPIGATTTSSGAFTTLASSGATTMTAGTASTSTSTGTLVVTGGIGVSGALYAGAAVLSTSASAGVGYATGAGGTITQITSRTTGVTLNKTTGAITMFTAAGSTTAATFTVTNSSVAATDTIVLNQKSGTNLYVLLVTAVAAGSFNITFYTTGGVASDAPVINFNVIKGVTS